MPIMIASIMNLVGPDMMVILLIVLLLFGAKKLPELARGMGRAVKEFSAARDEIEREITESRASKTTEPKLLSAATGELPTME
jgi:sec-independent protein translocase protein TatA